MKKKVVVLIFLIVCLILSFYLINKDLFSSNSIAKDIDENDKKKLSKFFKYYVVNDTWGYVFLGSKPVSYSTINTCNKIQNDGWTIWKKYKSRFEKKIIFLEKQNDFNPNFIDVFIINKNEFLKISHENQEKLSSCTNISERIYSIMKDEELFGIFLGYGENNSKKYYLLKFENDNEIKLNFFINKIDRLKLILKYFHLFNENIHFITLPNFMVDLNSLETKDLKKKYELSRKEIILHYKKKNFLDGTLELLLKDSVN